MLIKRLSLMILNSRTDSLQCLWPYVKYTNLFYRFVTWVWNTNSFPRQLLRTRLKLLAEDKKTKEKPLCQLQGFIREQLNDSD